MIIDFHVVVHLLLGGWLERIGIAIVGVVVKRCGIVHGCTEDIFIEEPTNTKSIILYLDEIIVNGAFFCVKIVCLLCFRRNSTTGLRVHVRKNNLLDAHVLWKNDHPFFILHA